MPSGRLRLLLLLLLGLAFAGSLVSAQLPPPKTINGPNDDTKEVSHDKLVLNHRPLYFHRIFFTGYPESYLSSGKVVYQPRMCNYYAMNKYDDLVPAIMVIRDIKVTRYREGGMASRVAGDRLFTYCLTDYRAGTTMGEIQLLNVVDANVYDFWDKKFRKKFWYGENDPNFRGFNYELNTTNTVNAYFNSPQYIPKSGEDIDKDKPIYDPNPPAVHKGWNPLDVVRDIYGYQPNATTWATSAGGYGNGAGRLDVTAHGRTLGINYKIIDKKISEQKFFANLTGYYVDSHKSEEDYSIEIVDVSCTENNVPVFCQNREFGAVQVRGDVKSSNSYGTDFCYPLSEAFIVFGTFLDEKVNGPPPTPATRRPKAAAGLGPPLLLLLLLLGGGGHLAL